MQFDEYQQLAMRTAKSDRAPELETCINAMGLAGEAGEFCDYIKKCVGHGHTMDKDVAAKELGDVLWYVAVNAERMNTNLESLSGSTDFETYQNVVALDNDDNSADIDLCLQALNLDVQVGKFIEYVIDGHLPFLRANRLNSLAKVLKCLAVLSNLLDLSFNDIAVANIEKLKERYPEGFSNEASLNRAEYFHLNRSEYFQEAEQCQILP